MREYTDVWRGRPNYESIQMPLYYALVGTGTTWEKRLGMEGGNLLYWARFFNVPVYLLLVWLACLFTKELLPHSKFVYLGVPFVLAFFPQDVFYGLNNDILSAPMVTLALYLLLRMYRSEAPRPGLALLAGFAVAAAVLTKFANAPVVVVLVIVACWKLGPAWRRKQWPAQPRARRAHGGGGKHPRGLLAGEELPRFRRSDGLCMNNRFKTWTPKPISEYWHHPIFTPGGFLYFSSRLATYHLAG